ncbi:MAG: hypothetical protein OXG61_06435 [Chloroflexi bacterium]|nr:hypothetical protein [Chloroflexota bacterium]
MDEKIPYRLWLKFRVGKALATAEVALTASLAGREVTIKSERQSQPLSEASWLLIECRGFTTEDEAKSFGQELRRAVHLAGLCARVGVDAGDPGEDRTVSWFNPELLRESGVLDPGARVGPDIHGLLVLPDDGKTLFFRIGQVEGTVRSSADNFVRALEEAFPEPEEAVTESPGLRRAVRVLNLAEMNTDPIAKVVLSISTIEGLAADPGWTKSQRAMITSAADWLEQAHGSEEATSQVIEAIRRTRHSSIRQRIRNLLAANELSLWWKEWEALYEKRNRLFHGRGGEGGEQRGGHLAESELHAMGQEAMRLCGRIVLSLAKRNGVAIPSQASVHFGIE